MHVVEICNHILKILWYFHKSMQAERGIKKSTLLGYNVSRCLLVILCNINYCEQIIGSKPTNQIGDSSCKHFYSGQQGLKKGTSCVQKAN